MLTRLLFFCPRTAASPGCQQLKSVASFVCSVLRSRACMESSVDGLDQLILPDRFLIFIIAIKLPGSRLSSVQSNSPGRRAPLASPCSLSRILITRSLPQAQTPPSVSSPFHSSNRLLVLCLPLPPTLVCLSTSLFLHRPVALDSLVSN